MTEAEGERPQAAGAGPALPGEGDGGPVRGAKPTPPDWPALIVLAAAAGGPVVIFSFLVIGERGNSVIQVLGLLLAFIGVMTPILAKYRVSETWRSMKPWQRVCFAATVFLVSAAISFVLYLFANIPAVPTIPGAIRIDGQNQLTPTTPATIVFVEPTPDRQNLGLKLVLHDYIKSGNCLNPATLALTPLKGGQEGVAVEVPRPGIPGRDPEEVTIPIGGSVRDLRITVALHSGVGCKLELKVHEAVFHG
jgi:hypothetical protein